MDDFIMHESKTESTRLEFSIEDISKWSKENSPVGIPALQRGLVWVPSQIELLWDSLMRGIPIGSFVICKRIESQDINAKKKDGFHLLDGQQRANAIQLGFDNPFNDSLGQKKTTTKAILWLDICPTILPDSTRNYLFRITTTAHPWGYNKRDNASSLSAKEIRNAIQWYCDDKVFDSECYIRPAPIDLYPIAANCPIPMGVLWEIYEMWNNNPICDLENISPFIKGYLEDNYLHDNKWDYNWVSRVHSIVSERAIEIQSVFSGLIKVKNTSILALKAPDDLLSQTKQEENNPGKADITAIEHLFQRLNRQGTELNGEELSYSMIKAYWPQVRNAIDAIENDSNLMPASRLVSLAMRTIKTEFDYRSNRGKNIPATALNVTEIRSLAVDDNKQQLQKTIKAYINNELATDIKCIDQLLGVVCQKDWGLPPVLRSSIAWHLPDVYLLLMLLVRKQKTIIEDEDISRALTGLVTWIKWFGGRDIRKVTSDLYTCERINLQSIRKIVGESIESGALNAVIPPYDLSNYLSLPDKINDNVISEWRFASLAPKIDEPQLVAKWICLQKLKSEREILLYAQRHYLKRRFKDYDPSRKDFWKEHNRPWDYDHIFAKHYAYGQKTNNTFLSFCQEWRDTNGNMRAWPFEANRSDQATPAQEKICDDQQLVDSFICKNELEGFNAEGKAISDSAKAILFAKSCRSRLIRIYSEWFYELKIYRLLPLEQSTEQIEQ